MLLFLSLFSWSPVLNYWQEKLFTFQQIWRDMCTAGGRILLHYWQHIFQRRGWFSSCFCWTLDFRRFFGELHKHKHKLSLLQVLQMESDVLNYLKFEMTAPTTKCFLRRFLRAAQGANEVLLEFLNVPFVRLFTSMRNIGSFCWFYFCITRLRRCSWSA